MSTIFTRNSVFAAHRCRVPIILFLLFGLSAPLLAQTISGQVTSVEDGGALPGVNVVIKGTTIGTITDIEGNYQLSAGEEAETLVFSFIGLRTEEVAINNRSTINLKMNDDVAELSEVVVTAFGLEREKKALGYTVQEVSGEQLSEAKQANVVNNLSGRIAGVQVTSNEGPGSGSNVVIRGQSSISGNNQPLYVIDGVPMENYQPAVNTDANSSNQYGGGPSEISSDNIADVSVLKGPNAAALYGSRAANGVILITTKDGTGTEGLGVEFNSNAMWSRPLVSPNFQNTYGGGTGYRTFYVDGRNGVDANGNGGTYGVDESWGEPMDGRLRPQWWTGGQITDAGIINNVAPLTPEPDNFQNFFETGQLLTNNIALAGSNDKGNFRLSIGRMAQDGIVHNNDYFRNNFRLNAGYNLTDRLSVRVASSYINSYSNNRRYQSGSQFIWTHRNTNWDQLRDYETYNPETVIQPIGQSYPYANWQYEYFWNPFYTEDFWTFSNNKDRLVGNIALNYKLTDHLSLMLRSGTDFWNDTRQNIIAEKNARYYPNGAYEETVLGRQETNSDFLLTYDNQITSDLSLTANVGGNSRMNSFKRNYTLIQDLAINGLYNLGNYASPPVTESAVEEYQVNSLFGSAQFGFKNYLFLDITGRNDWSSTLPAENNSFFYPSASLSAVITDIFDIQSGVLSFMKLRGSWAQVGNDTQPYRLQQLFNGEGLWAGSTPVVSEDTEIANSELRPETTTGIELGTDIRLFNNRIGLDFTYYDQTTTDQILAVEISRATGYTYKLLNAGEVQNRGVELMLTATPVQLPSGFTWDVMANWSRNRSQVNELADGLDTYVLNTYHVTSEARVGRPFGELRGTFFARDPDGNVIYRNGQPVAGANEDGSTVKTLGNIQPDWTAGISNTFRYKGITLSALIDIRHGGDIFDRGSSVARRTGQLAETAVGREEGVIGVGVKNIGTAEAPQYVTNDVVVDAQSFMGNHHPRNINEVAIFDASYVKLREITLGYTLPSTLLERTNLIESVKVSVVGRNLAILHRNTPHIDPEGDRYGGNLQGFVYGQLPSTRSVGFNLNITF
ncbi:MAG: SusC/RagA family TonB-linked outer membrane protein [Tunicatimonas sp.]